MSRSPDRPGGRPLEDGFTLIEIIVALGIFSLVLVALLPQLITGIRATGTARVVSQAKGVSQGQLEQMRHLPFHIAPAAGDFVDVLDYYFPDLDPPGTSPTCIGGDGYALPAPGWTGYVAAGSASRCDYEPANGAFFRTVKTIPASAGTTAFTLVVDTQFLSGATPPVPVSPLSGYNTGAVGKDSPASSQIGVTVTVLYDRRGTLRPVSSYTQIAERLRATTRVRSEADVRVLDLGTVTKEKIPLSLSAGLLDLAGSVSYASTVGANLAATSAGLATGEQDAGASATLQAPPSRTTTLNNAGAGSLSTFGCLYACWGGTSIPAISLSADQGLPLAGSPTSPAQVLLTDLGQGGLGFGAGAADTYRPALDLVAPLVRMHPDAAAVPSGISAGCVPGPTGPSAYLSGSGYLRATDSDDSEEVESCVVARAATLELFPTGFAPHGVLQLELTGASAGCLVAGSGHTASTSYDYKAVVRYYDGNPDGGDYTVAANIAKGATSDPLEGVPLTTSIGGDRKLGDYIASWSSLTTDQVLDTAAAGAAQVKLPGVLKIVSQPVRPDATVTSGLDEGSVVSLTLGALSCRAEDAR